MLLWLPLVLLLLLLLVVCLECWVGTGIRSSLLPSSTSLSSQSSLYSVPFRATRHLGTGFLRSRCTSREACPEQAAASKVWCKRLWGVVV